MRRFVFSCVYAGLRELQVHQKASVLYFYSEVVVQNYDKVFLRALTRFTS